MYYLPHVRLFCGYVGRSVVWLVCRLIGLSWHNLRGGRCTSLLLLEHLQVLVRGSSGSFDRWHGFFDFLLMNQSWKSTSFNWLYIYNAFSKFNKCIRVLNLLLPPFKQVLTCSGGVCKISGLCGTQQRRRHEAVQRLDVPARLQRDATRLKAQGKARRGGWENLGVFKNLYKGAISLQSCMFCPLLSKVCRSSWRHW